MPSHYLFDVLRKEKNISSAVASTASIDLDGFLKTVCDKKYNFGIFNIFIVIVRNLASVGKWFSFLGNEKNL